MTKKKKYITTIKDLEELMNELSKNRPKNYWKELDENLTPQQRKAFDEALKREAKNIKWKKL
jgi:hypothetical protein